MCVYLAHAALQSLAFDVHTCLPRVSVPFVLPSALASAGKISQKLALYKTPYVKGYRTFEQRFCLPHLEAHQICPSSSVLYLPFVLQCNAV